MLCYRCGSHADDSALACPTCGQSLAGGSVILRQATGTFSRRKMGAGGVEGAPYKTKDVIAGRYLVLDVIGAGPSGVVFRVHDKETDVDVALKVIRAHLCQTGEDRQAFAAMATLARKVSHPNVVRVYEDGEENGLAYLTSQYLDGMSLKQIIDLRLQKKQFFLLHEIDPILSQLCNALDAAHKVGVHGNVRPENILVLPDVLKLTDFGLGLGLPRFPFIQAMKTAKAEGYFSPEFRGGAAVDARSDVFSVGALLGEMLSGKLPEGAPVELLDVNPSVPRAIDGVYRKAVSQSPFLRFGSLSELYQAFVAIAAEYPPPVVPLGAEANGPSGSRRKMDSGRFSQAAATKPPPPVPDDASAAEAFPDATQPVDAAQLKVILEDLERRAAHTKVPPTVPPVNVFLAPSAPAPSLPTQALVPSISIPPPIASAQAFVQQPVPSIAPQPLFAASRPAALIRFEWKYVGLVAVLGFVLGAAAGYLRLSRAAEAAVQPAATVPEPAGGNEQTARARAQEEAARLMHADTASVTSRIDAGATAQSPNDDRVPKGKPIAGAEKTAGREKVTATGGNVKSADKDERVLAAAGAALPVAGDGKCPDGTKLIAAGAFRMGTAADDSMVGFDEKPLSPVFVDAFCIDVYEFPNRKGSQPRTAITFNDAQRECQNQNKRLCTEAEWEKVCKGPGQFKWPYGNTFDASKCVTEDASGESRSLTQSGQFARCRSEFGVADLSGNAAEWTQDKVIKGGAFGSGDYAVRCASRKAGSGFSKSSEVGFRCCSSFRK